MLNCKRLECNTNPVSTDIYHALLTVEMEGLRREMENLREGHQRAQLQSQESSTKLSVLTEYFKQKEVELQK